ncbi:MAG TPA: ROK family protein, partial [Phycisphaerae bacterium]|nr:ROK family protein [Phycisphaerae bacterium]
MPPLSVLNILRTIKEHGTLSRTDLQNITRLSWGTITNTTRELLERNLIREEGTSHTKAGRKPMRLAINPITHVLIGVDVSPNMIRTIAMNLAGETLDYRESPCAKGDAPQVVLDLIAKLVLEMMHNPAVAPRSCLGVGVAVQGAVDVKKGLLRFAPRMPGWQNVEIREYLQLKVAAPVLV